MQKTALFLLCSLLVSCGSPSDNNTTTDNSTEVAAKPKTEEELLSDIKRAFAEINQNSASYQTKSKEIMGESTEGGVLESYYQGEELKKLTVSYFGEMGKAIEEYYWSDNEVFFAFTQKQYYDKPMYVEGSKVEKTTENRYYFHEGKLIQWLDPNKEKVARSAFSKKETELSQKIKALVQELER